MPESPLSTSQYTQLCEFAHTVWGNSKAVLQQSGDINFIDLQPYPVFQHLFAGAVSHDKILIRQEYHTALQALETKTYYRGAYVTGQPGIGKTLFLIYVLVMHLGQKRAVALQLPNGQPYYALFHASVSIHSLNNPNPLDKFPHLWVLADSNKQVKCPSGIFLGTPEEIRVIHTAPPQEIWWKGWSKQTCATGYVMDIWSTKEIFDLSKLLGLDSEHMTTLAKHWGGVPQSVLQLMDKTDSEIEACYRAYAMKAVPKCRDMIPAITQSIAQFDQSPPQIFFCQPRITEYGINRELPRTTVPTPTICHFLVEALQFQTDSIMLQFFDALYQSSKVSANS